jgi:alanine dehydrogenase
MLIRASREINSRECRAGLEPASVRERVPHGRVACRVVAVSLDCACHDPLQVLAA